MLEKDYILGGEQSGHIIFLDYNTTGDGLLSAIQLLCAYKESSKNVRTCFNYEYISSGINKCQSIK